MHKKHYLCARFYNKHSKKKKKHNPKETNVEPFLG